jgi:molecular chaperone GrpE (heat shock protein)
MPDASPTVDPDFSAQMQALVIEAEQARGDKPDKNGERRAPAGSPAQMAPEIAMAQLLRPIFLGMESLMRSQSVQNLALDRLEKALENHASVPEVLNDARQSLDQRNVVNRAMFEALHADLKRYKDDFLLEAVVRPVVRDLVSLYDDAHELYRQFCRGIADSAANGEPAHAMGVLKTLEKNLEHHIHYLLEVLERMEVRMLPPQLGKLDKRNQRVVAREAATREEDDLVVIRSVRPAFSWRTRLFRPEEVVVLKWGLSADGANDADAQDSPPA